MEVPRAPIVVVLATPRERERRVRWWVIDEGMVTEEKSMLYEV